MGSFMILLKELHGDWYFKMAATSGQNVTKDIWQLESEYKTNFQKQQMWWLDDLLPSLCFIFGWKSKMVATTDQSLTYASMSKSYQFIFLQKTNLETAGYCLTHDSMLECTQMFFSETTSLI